MYIYTEVWLKVIVPALVVILIQRCNVKHLKKHLKVKECINIKYFNLFSTKMIEIRISHVIKPTVDNGKKRKDAFNITVFNVCNHFFK